MGKGISLAELNRMHRAKKAIQPVRRPPKSSVVKTDAKIIRELGQQLTQFERQHFRPREQKQEPLQARLLLFFIGILGICIFSLMLWVVVVVTWGIFLLNIGNFYFWGYVFLVTLLFFQHDSAGKIWGLIVLIIGWWYWLFTTHPF